MALAATGAPDDDSTMRTLTAIGLAIGLATYLLFSLSAGRGSETGWTRSAVASDIERRTARPGGSADETPHEALETSRAEASTRASADSCASPSAASRAATSPPRPLDIDGVMGTFLSEDPDLEGLQALVMELADRAELAEVRVDPYSGVVSGTVKLEGLPIAAEFEVADRDYRVELSLPPTASGQFLLRTLTIGFREDLGRVVRGSTNIQHHPNSSSSWGEPGELSYVGWHVEVQNTGTVAAPMMMKASPSGVGGQVGWLGGEKLEREWDWDREHYAPWLSLLSSSR